MLTLVPGSAPPLSSPALPASPLFDRNPLRHRWITRRLVAALALRGVDDGFGICLAYPCVSNTFDVLEQQTRRCRRSVRAPPTIARVAGSPPPASALPMAPASRVLPSGAPAPGAAHCGASPAPLPPPVSASAAPASRSTVDRLTIPRRCSTRQWRPAPRPRRMPGGIRCSTSRSPVPIFATACCWHPGM